jgi:ribosomal protein L37AE/L43A
MGINQVQFQKGLSMPEFLEKYGTVANCHQALVDVRWPRGFVCPDCGSTRHGEFERKGLHYWQCRDCRTQTTVTCGTIFESSKLPLTIWFLAMHLLTQSKNNVSALELKRHLGVRYRTAWLLKHKLMQVMCEREAPRILDGRVEIDDAYLGGELPGGKAGRGSENKVSFIAAVQTTDAGHPLAVCLKKLAFTKEAIGAWAKTALAASATVVSDGLWCFQAVSESGAAHERIVTGGGHAGVKLEQFKAVNTFLGNLKTAYSGTYHAFDFAKYAHRYLAEAQYRFNRRFNLSSILVRRLQAACLTIPTPAAAIRVAEVGR